MSSHNMFIVEKKKKDIKLFELNKHSFWICMLALRNLWMLEKVGGRGKNSSLLELIPLRRGLGY